jgi:hypothetical protein
MATHGFAELDGWAASERAAEASRVGRYADAIDALADAKLPPAFLLAFDEPWHTARALASTFGAAYGMRLLDEFAVHAVRPGGGGGFAARRGRGAARAFRSAEEGTLAQLPRRTTVWLALSDCSPRTSCLYALPARHDVRYQDEAEGEEGGEEGGVAATAALGMLAATCHQHVRALPTLAGAALATSHRLLHWLSSHAGRGRAAYALALTIADGTPSAASSPPLLRVAVAGVPCLDARLALIVINLVATHDTEPLPQTQLSTLLPMLHAHAEHLADAALDARTHVGRRVQTHLAQMHAALADSGAGFGDDGASDALAAIGMLAHYVQHTRRLSVVGALAPLATPPTATPPHAKQPRATPPPATPTPTGPPVTPTAQPPPAVQRTPEPAVASSVPAHVPSPAAVEISSSDVTYEEVD